MVNGRVNRTPTGAADAAAVAEQAVNARDLATLDSRIVDCRACPRLVQWRETIATEKRKSFAGQTYWGRPVPGFGDTEPSLLIIGLAPAAHGGNRTGRVFTGDRSGDWLFASLYRVGQASQPTSQSVDDGLVLYKTRVAAAVRCAPPANQPSTEERDTCSFWLDRELALVQPSLKVIVTLGAFAWSAALAALVRAGQDKPRGSKFGHGAELQVGGLLVIGSFHPSQQNTFTGRLTEAMTDAVFTRARQYLGDA